MRIALRRISKTSVASTKTGMRAQGTVKHSTTRVERIVKSTSKNQVLSTGITLSPTATSFENRVMICPTEVESKKATLALISALSIKECSLPVCETEAQPVTRLRKR